MGKRWLYQMKYQGKSMGSMLRKAEPKMYPAKPLRTQKATGETQSRSGCRSCSLRVDR